MDYKGIDFSFKDICGIGDKYCDIATVHIQGRRGRVYFVAGVPINDFRIAYKHVTGNNIDTSSSYSFRECVESLSSRDKYLIADWFIQYLMG